MRFQAQQRLAGALESQAALEVTPASVNLSAPRANPWMRGKISSLASACNIPGAPIMLPSADESVAANTRH